MSTGSSQGVTRLEATIAKAITQTKGLSVRPDSLGGGLTVWSKSPSIYVILGCSALQNPSEASTYSPRWKEGHSEYRMASVISTNHDHIFSDSSNQRVVQGIKDVVGKYQAEQLAKYEYSSEIKIGNNQDTVAGGVLGRQGGKDVLSMTIICRTCENSRTR